MWESNKGTSTLLHSPSNFQPVFSESGINLLITANETIMCLKFILQHLYSFLPLSFNNISLVEITWRQIGVSRKTRPRSKLFMSLNFRMLLCWPFAHFQSSSTEMDWIDHIPPIVPVSFAMATGDTLTNAATLPFKTKVMQWLLQFFQRQQTQDISLFNQWTNISKYLVSPLCCLLGHCYRPGSRSCLWKGT